MPKSPRKESTKYRQQRVPGQYPASHHLQGAISVPSAWQGFRQGSLLRARILRRPCVSPGLQRVKYGVNRHVS